MVERREPDADGITRPVTYATLRTDKPAVPGHTAELVSVDLDPKYYDDLGGQPSPFPGYLTFLDYFEKHVKERPNDPFLGQREKLNDSTFGEYQWKSFQEVSNIAQDVARGMVNLDLVTQTSGDGKNWSFVGLWSPNRWEWLTTHIANMYYNNTTIGFFDSMGASSVDFILNQTELSCIFTTGDYIEKIITMKKNDQAKTIRFLVCFDQVSTAQVDACKAQGVKLYDFNTVIEAGKQDAKPFTKCTEHDCPLFSYTSGTTGDSKGVKLTHKNLLSSAYTIMRKVPLTREDSTISYLPYPHSFEQVVTFYAIIIGIRIGYYQGKPEKLTEDCAMLQPSLFPSVPRLFNKIYSKIKGTFDTLTGCKGWLANRGLQAKLYYNRIDGTVNHGCYDKLIFNKIAALLGGRVRFMITGSAPIDPAVLELLRVCLCTPFLEGYGLTETSGGASCSWPEDPIMGHVGGPLPCVKWRLADVPDMNYLSTDKPFPRGELEMFGASVTSGYYKRPDKTEEAFTKDGWFKTGDVAMLYPNGSVKIIDRSKNIFKLSQGEYIAPEKIENIFALSKKFAQTLLYGDSLRSCCVAIVIPDEAYAKQWAAQNEISFDMKALCENAKFKEELMAEINSLCKEHKLSGLERPKDISLSAEPMTIENNLITPTFKLKRNVAKVHYKAQIDAMYDKLAF